MVRELRTEKGNEARKLQRYVASSRKILGAFRMTVAVKMGDDLLPKAVRHLALLRYIALAIPAGDHWYPVFSRYIKQLAGQVDALGYDADSVKPSADDAGMPGDRPHSQERCYTGKVHEIVYDCFGSFVGFSLRTCSQRHWIDTCERGIEAIVLEACRHDATLSVRWDGKRVCGLAIVCC
ncbi:hypothetical protein LP420_39200 [Massilia sp. B-10]|nr:hypothetical protein LP420_39200 [Massilia sp. B-10]